MTWSIKIIEDVLGLDAAHDEAWVKAYDPDAGDGRGFVHTTPNPTEALRFDTPGEAFTFYRQQSKVHPIRWTDGRPNRPLTAYTVSIEQTPRQP